MPRRMLLALAALAVLGAIPTTKQAPTRKATATTSISVVDEAAAARSADDHAIRNGKKSKANKKGPGSAKAGGAYTVTQVDLPPAITGTGFMERIQIMTPFGYDPFGANVPLLLVGNGYGLSAASFFNGMSDVPNEANNRGWLICVVTQLDDKSFGAWNKPQSNVIAALDHMVGNYRVDTSRIYALGWSMGGGSMASYAARHLDPAKPMIAALAVNAGTVDLVDAYNHEVSSVQTLMQNPTLFGGPPSGAAFHFNYERTETVFTTPAGGPLNTNYCQARNLLNVPVFHVYSTDDEIPYLPKQNQDFDNLLVGIGANLTTQTFSGLFDSHSWDLIDPVQTLNWFQSHTLNKKPATYAVNADRNATYYWTTLTQRTAGAFSRIAVDADAPTNDVVLSGIENLSSITISPPIGILNFATRLTLTVQNTDPGPVTVKLTGAGLVSPTYILAGTDVFDAWTYTGSSLDLVVPAQATTAFTIAFDVYSAKLTSPVVVNLGTSMAITLQATTPNKPYLLLIATDTYPTPLSLIDPGDTRYVLAAVTPSTIFLLSTLGPAASQALSVYIPVNPTYIGVELAMQFLTYPGTTTIVDEISNLAKTRLQ